MTGKRSPDKTRAAILDAAFKEIVENGFQAASITNILAQTNLTKGALYHHFANKKALGYAIVDEWMPQHIDNAFFRPMRDEGDFFKGYQRAFKECDPEKKQMLVRYGSPGFKLAQEMSHLDEGFQIRLDKMFAWWREGIADTIRIGQERGQIKKSINPEDQAFIMQTLLLGGVSLSKIAQSEEMLDHASRLFLDYLETLRA